MEETRTPDQVLLERLVDRSTEALREKLDQVIERLDLVVANLEEIKSQN